MAFAWAAGICAAGVWPPTPSNLSGLNSWITCENGSKVTANNPLNTSSKWNASGMKNSIVSAYPNPVTGARACARTIKGLDNMRGWPLVASSLRAGTLGHDFRSGASTMLAGWGTNPGCVVSGLGGPAPGSGGTQGSSSGAGGPGGPSLKDKATAALGLGAVGVGGLTLVAILVIGVAAFFLLRRKAS